MANRFRQYQYALCRFFRQRGYEVNSIKKTIKIDPYDLTAKELKRLSQLKTWGFSVISPKVEYRYSNNTHYEVEESFIDFADEIIEMYRNNPLK